MLSTGASPTLSEIRRSRYISFDLEDEKNFDIEALLSGRVEFDHQSSQIVATSHLTFAQKTLTLNQLALLIDLPTHWIDADHSALGRSEGSRPFLTSLISDGFILARSYSHLADTLIERHLRLDSNHWSKTAYFFHTTVLQIEAEQCQDPEIINYESKLQNASEDAESFIRQFGPPPPAHFEYGCSNDLIELSPPEEESNLFKLLESRRTCRSFAKGRSISFQTFSTLLKLSFGALGTYRIADSHKILHKSCPSGGGLHPIEAFPIVMNIDGVKPGIYHYDCVLHRLMRRDARCAETLRRLAAELAQNQAFVSSAAFLVILIARWERNFWKYRGRPQTYNVIMMDAGHLNQTFHLAATSYGLGSFYTAALDHHTILEILGLEPECFGALGLCGCGIQDPSAPELELSPID